MSHEMTKERFTLLSETLGHSTAIKRLDSIDTGRGAEGGHGRLSPRSHSLRKIYRPNCTHTEGMRRPQDSRVEIRAKDLSNTKQERDK
jgi:hypothetical protein